MNKCPLVDKFSQNVEEFIKDYETIINDDTLSDIETTSAEDTLKGLYAYKKAIKENDLEFVNAFGDNKNRALEENEKLLASFKRTLGERFLFNFGNSSVKKQGRVKKVFFVDGNVKVNFTTNSKEYTYSFSVTSNDRSHSTGKNNRFINLEGFRDFLDDYEVNKRNDDNNELVLGSRDSRMKLGENYKQDGYVHGNLDHMKNTLDKLHVLGGSKADQEELTYLHSLLDKTDSKFFNSLKLYVKEEASKTDGVYRSQRIDVAIDPLPKSAGNQQSEASVYVEEVIHSMTASAIHSNTLTSNKLKRRLDTFIELARKNVTWKSFLPENSIDADKEKLEAEIIYDYIFNSKNKDYEFIAKGLTVPAVIKAFKHIKIVDKNDSKSIMSYINSFFSQVIDILRGNFTLKDKSKNVHEGLINLAFSLGEINVKKNRDLKEKEGFLGSVVDLINAVDDKTAFLINLGKNKLKDKINSTQAEEIPTDLYGRVKFTAKAVARSFVDPVYTKTAGVVAGAYNINPEGTVREIIGGLLESDSAQIAAEKLAMQSGYKDKIRNIQAKLVRSKTLDGFKSETEITKEIEEAMTEVLAETDLTSIAGRESITNKAGDNKVIYDNKTLRKILTDSEFLSKAISNVKKTLKDLDGVNYFWHRDQAVGLGIFMASHTGNDSQNLNAENIAKGFQSSHRKAANKNVVKAIDELATLVAVQKSNQEQKTVVAELMQKDWKGVEDILDMLEGFKRNSDAAVFKGNKTQKIKGYVREVFDDSIVIEIAPAENRRDMEAKGFIFKTTLGARAGDRRNSTMALYVTDSSSRPDRVRGATRMNQITSRGQSITDISYKDSGGFESNVVRLRAKRDIENIKRNAAKKIKLMEEGKYDFKEGTFGVVPILDNDGNIVDYRYMMNKENKKSLLKQDKTIAEVMSKSFASLIDKEESKKHNKLVLDEILKDMSENWTSGIRGNDNLTEYSLVGPNSSNRELRKIYYMLPYEFREAIKNRQDKTLAVRRDLLHLYFGYSNISIVDFPMLKKITPKIIIRFLQFSEMMWMEMIKVVKGNILLKIPAVLTSNIFSNLIYAVMNGYNPIKVLKMYTESYRDISRYNKITKNIKSLENDVSKIRSSLRRDLLSENRKKELINNLKRNLDEIKAEKIRKDKNPINELVLLGLDQNVEDMTDDSTGDTNKITSYIEDKLEPLPELVKDGLDILFMTRRTSFYKVANEFLETSDLIARDVQNRFEKDSITNQANGKKILPVWWTDKKESTYNPKQKLLNAERKEFLKEALDKKDYDLIEDFVNYTKPSGRFEEYLNKVGVLMFTKYVKRIQRIVLKSGSRSPLKTAATVAALSMLGGFPTIQEQFFLNKDWYGDSLGAGNVFPVYGPIEQFMNFITPAAVRNVNEYFL